MHQPLYRLADDYLAIAHRLADLDLPDEVISDTLAGLTGDLETKAWNIAALIQQFDVDIAAIRDAERRMAGRRKTLERRVEWLRGYLLAQLDRVGINSIDSPEFVIRLRDSPPHVVLDDESAIPDAYRHAEIVTTVRKDAIRRTLLSGDSVPGTHLERGRQLVIK